MQVLMGGMNCRWRLQRGGGCKKSHSVQTTKKIEQNLSQGLSTLTCGIQILRAAYFKTKRNLKKIWKWFYATFCCGCYNTLKIFFLPMKTWKNQAQKLLIIHIWIFPLTALSYPYGRKLKIHIGIWSEAPYVLSTFWYKFPQYIYGYINFSYMYLYM